VGLLIVSLSVGLSMAGSTSREVGLDSNGLENVGRWWKRVERGQRAKTTADRQGCNGALGRQKSEEEKGKGVRCEERKKEGGMNEVNGQSKRGKGRMKGSRVRRKRTEQRERREREKRARARCALCVREYVRVCALCASVCLCLCVCARGGRSSLFPLPSVPLASRQMDRARFWLLLLVCCLSVMSACSRGRTESCLLSPSLCPTPLPLERKGKAGGRQEDGQGTPSLSLCLFSASFCSGE